MMPSPNFDAMPEPFQAGWRPLASPSASPLASPSASASASGGLLGASGGQDFAALMDIGPGPGTGTQSAALATPQPLPQTVAMGEARVDAPSLALGEARVDEPSPSDTSNGNADLGPDANLASPSSPPAVALAAAPSWSINLTSVQSSSALTPAKGKASKQLVADDRADTAPQSAPQSAPSRADRGHGDVRQRIEGNNTAAGSAPMIDTASNTTSVSVGPPTMLAPLVNMANLLATPEPVPAPNLSQMTHAAILDMSAGDAWLSQLSSDIERLAEGGGTLRFRLSPETLGHLAVRIERGEAGLDVRMMTQNAMARDAIADGQARIIAEARSHGVTVSSVTVEQSPASSNAAGNQGQGLGHGPGQGLGHGQQHQPTAAMRGNFNRSEEDTNASQAGSRHRPSSDRYA